MEKVRKFVLTLIPVMFFLLSLFMLLIEKNTLYLLFFALLSLSLLYRSKKNMEKYYIFSWIIFVTLSSNITVFDISLPLPISINSQIEFSFIRSLFLFLFLITLQLSFGYTALFLLGNKKFSVNNLPLAWGTTTGIMSIFLILFGITIGFLFNLIFILQLLSFIFIIYRIIKEKRKFNFPFTSLIPSFIITLPFLLTSIIHSVFYPELYWDSLAYGINLSRIYLVEEKIPLIAGGPSLGIELSSNYPPAYQVLLAYFFYFCGESTQIARLFSLANAIFLIILTYYWSKEIFRKRIYHLFSLIILVSIPLFILFSRYSIFYIYFTLQASLSFYFLYRFFARGSKNDIYISSIFAGFSFLSSYLGIIPAFAIFLTTLFFKRDLESTILTSLLFILISSPWLFRNLFLLNNPLWPFFGGKFIDEKIWNNTILVQKQMQKVLGFSFDDLNTLENSIQRLFFAYPNFFNGIIINGLKPFLQLFAIPAFLLALKRKNRKMIFFSFLLLLNLFFYILVFNWFERYTIAACLPTVFLSVFLLSFFEKSKVKFLMFSITIVLFFNSIFFSLLWDECHSQNEKNYENILENIGNYEWILEFCYGNSVKAWKWISSNTEMDAKIATNDIRDYYLNRSVIHTDSWNLRGLYYVNKDDECIQVLCTEGVSYLYINPYANAIIPTCLNNITSRKAKIVANYKDIKIYKLEC